MATKKKEVVQDVESELQRLTKKHKNLVERKAEVDQKLEGAETELNANRDQFVYVRRQLDETSIEKQVAEKSKADIEASYRHLVELKKQNNKNIVSLQLQANTLDVKLQEYHKKEARHQEQKKHDLQAIDSQRHQLQTQQVYNARKLENEERQLQAKFQNTKAEIKRKFVKDLDELKQTHTNVINDETQKHKSKMDHLDKHVGDKIGDLQSESRAMRREYDILSLEIRELAERQARLEQTCKKEKLISATNGTDSIEWLAKAGLNDGGHRSVIADQERVVNDLRQRYLSTGDQLQVVTKQKQANAHALKKTKQDLEEQIRLFQLLEISKKDMERRLSKRNTELDEQLVRKKQVVANEHVTKKAKLQAESDAKADECKDLQKQIYDLEAELSSIHLSTHSLSLRMNEKLEAERNHLHLLEEEKRDWEIRARLLKASVDTLTEQLASMEKETARLKGQAFAAQNDMVEEQDRNHLLEQSIKRLESRI